MKKFLAFSILILFVCLFILVLDKTQFISAYDKKEIESETKPSYTIEEANDVVYALANVNLRTLPGMEGSVVRIAEYGEEFNRTGSTSTGWNRFVLSDGTIAYSLGICFTTDSNEIKEVNPAPNSGNRVILPVNFISQLPELPTGCEITALTTVLNYLGYGVNKETLSDQYLPKGPAGSTNFNTAFVGDPRSTDSYGCYIHAIISAANQYLLSVNGSHKVIDISGYSQEQLYYEVRMGNPIIIWGTINNVEPKKSTSWIVEGEKITWLAGEHAFVLIGFDLDKNTVIVCDSLNGIMEYNADLFFTRYQQMYSQALLIKE